MIVSGPLALPPEAAVATKDYLRVERADEDALIAGLMTSAAELCEDFTGQALIERGFVETIEARPSWKRLARTPVRAITGVAALPPEGEPVPLATGAYSIDVDSNGDGWVRIAFPGEARVRVTYEAGLAAAWDEVPAALRLGIVRLAAHLYMNRASEGARAPAEPPVAVTALWRPFRRFRLG